MSLLILVRHGQASFDAEDYDQLSPLGERQSQRLGQFWAARDARFSAVFCGPLKRHRQTLTAVSQPYPHLPASQPLPQLAEHQAMEVFSERLPALAQQDDSVGDHVRRFLANDNPRHNRLYAFVQFTRQWASGEQPSGSHETWADFRQRIASGLEEIVSQAGNDQTVVAFTSGGVIAAAVGYALKLDDLTTMKLNAAVYNASLTSFRFTRDRFSLSQFNTVPHLAEEELLTYI